MSSNVTRHVAVLFVVGLALAGAVAPVAVATTGAAGAGVDAGVGATGETDAEATLSVGSASAPAGETVTVPIAVDGTGIAGYQANLTWDESVLRLESVSGADFSKPVTNGGPGWVFMTQSQSDGVDSPTVATVTFTVVGDAGDEAALSFVARDSSVNNESAQLETALESGAVAVGESATVSEDSVATTTDGTTSQGTATGDSATTVAATTDGDDGTTTSQGADADGDDGGPSPLLLVAGLLGASGVLGVGYFLGQRGGDGGE